MQNFRVVKRILTSSQVMAQQLKKAKCEVHVANHGADALFFLEKTTFAKGCGPYATPLSIILMDLEMPVMDGLTCIRRIREWQKQGKLTRPVPVIAVSRINASRTPHTKTYNRSRPMRVTSKSPWHKKQEW